MGRREAERDILEAIALRLEASGIIISNNVKVRTPVDTGRLRAAQTYDVGEDEVRVGSNIYYQEFQELGTRYQRPQPHLVPGLEASNDELRRVWGEPIR